MRQLFQEQLQFPAPTVDHRHARELHGIDKILRKHPDMFTLVLQDLQANVLASRDGRIGMSAEQVLRAAVLKQLQQWSYEELSFHLADSMSYRAFCGIGILGAGPGKATLQRNIKAITDETWHAINRILLGSAAQEGVEDGRNVRTDGTVTKANVHEPSDSSLLWDAVRVLTRLLVEARGRGVRRFPERCRRAKRRMLGILNAKGERQRRSLYRDLIAVTEETVTYANQALAQLKPLSGAPEAAKLSAKIQHYRILAEAVIDQTTRRVLHGEQVPADEKIFSIFEDHTDIIIKDTRAVHYGHKLTLSTGRSGLVLDWIVEDGNPADSTLVTRTVERLKEIYGRVPRQIALDGCYASKNNLHEAKALGVKDVAFSKKRGLEVLDMVKSHWVYKRLTNFRAGVEAWISLLKRSFGLDRCTWRGWAGFRQYVGASIVAANLLTLVRHLMKPPKPRSI